MTGSIASMLYGEPRLTVDLDLVVALGVGNAAAFLEAELDGRGLAALWQEAFRRA